MAKRYFTLIVIVTVLALIFIGGLRFVGKNKKDQMAAGGGQSTATTTVPAPLPAVIGGAGLLTSHLVIPLNSSRDSNWTSQNSDDYELSPNTVYNWVVQNKMVAKVSYYDLTDWATKNTYDGNGGIKFTSSWKQSCLQGLYTFSQNSTSTCSALPIDTLYDNTYALFHHSNLASDYERGDVLGVIQTPSNLHGLYYITFSPQSVEYVPTLEVYLTGRIDGRQVLIKGEFKLYDARAKEVVVDMKKLGNEKTAKLITQYRDDVKVRHQIPADLQTLINQALAYFDTLQIVTEKVGEYTR